MSEFPRPLYRNEVKCPALDMKMIFHSHVNKTHFHKKGCVLGLILKVRVFVTREWPIGYIFFQVDGLIFNSLIWLIMVLHRTDVSF